MGRLTEVNLANPTIAGYLFRGTLHEQGAIDEHRYKARELEHQVHVVLDQEHRHVAGKGRNDGEDGLALILRNAGRRFIQQQHRRLARNGKGNFEKPLFAIGQGDRAFLHYIGKPETLKNADDLRDHFIVCGYGRMGRIIVDEFRRQDVPFVVIDREAELVHELVAAGSLAVAADAGSEDVLRRIGIDYARGLISAVGSDAENVYIILSARLTRPDLFIIGRAENEDAIAKLRRAGADRVFSPYQAGAHQMAQAALRPAVVDFVQLATSSERLELGIEQIRLTPASPLCGQSLAAANVRQRFGVVVVGVQRAGGKMEFNPAPETEMSAGDHLIVMGRPDTLKQLEGAAAGARA